MTLSVANAKKMLFTTRFPPDKILDTFEGSFTATLSSSPPFSANRTEYPFNHNLVGGTAYLQMRYSLDGGTTWEDQHVTVPDLSVPTAPVFDTLEVGCYCTAAQIIMVASNFTALNKTVTYKVVAFAI
jgi:hypothetical protein